MAQSSSARIPLLAALSTPTACNALADTLCMLLTVPLELAMAAVREEVQPIAAVPQHAPGAAHAAEQLLGGRLIAEARMAGALMAQMLLLLADKPFKISGEVRGGHAAGMLNCVRLF